MSNEYLKLVDPSEFIDDEPVEFAAVDEELLPGPIDRKYWVYISERLWSRLLSMGSAYDLHCVRTLEPIIDAVLRPEQCESLVEEIEFLKGVVNDQALIEAIDVIYSEAVKVLNRKWMRLVISPP